jgi:tryptophan synthase alpha subunit
VIVGSAIVNIVEKNLDNPAAMEKELRQYVAGMKKATRQ